MALYLGPNLISGVFTSYHTTTYDTSDANATSADILMGKKAYVNGNLVTGNIPSRTGNDVTTSGATFTIPAGHYASAYTGNISNGALRTPSYSTNNSIAEVTITYGVSTAGYLATSTPTWTFRPFGNVRASVVSTYGSTITPSTTGTKTITVPAGYYPTAETITIAKATGGMQVATGTISASNTTTISGLGFTPKGIMMIYDSTPFIDSDLNAYTFYAINTTSGTGRYSTQSGTSSGGGGTFDDPPISWIIPAYSAYDTSYLYLGDVRLSVVFELGWGYTGLVSDEGVSAYTLYDWAYEGFDSGGSSSSGKIAGFGTFSGTVSFASGSVTITIGSSYWVGGNWTYVCWG